MYELRNILSFDHPIREPAQLSPPAIAIFADTAKRLVAARLQRGQHAVEQFESWGRPPDRFPLNGVFVEAGFVECFCNPLFALFVLEPCERESLYLIV
jgi:hypothetical protein